MSIKRHPTAMRKCLPLILAIALQIPTSAFAWFDMGHMIVAAYTYQRLEPSVRVKVSALLKLNPEYENWVQGVPTESRDIVAFTRARTWADDIKKHHDYRFGSVAQDGDHAADNIGYSDFLVHAY